jgi:hypothetical protein
MPFPNTIDIIGREYEVLYKDELAGDVGQCDYEKLQIHIKTGQQPFLEADTILHEIIHAIDDAMQTKMSERQVHCTATGIMALLKNNQEFLEYLYKATKQ